MHKYGQTTKSLKAFYSTDINKYLRIHTHARTHITRSICTMRRWNWREKKKKENRMKECRKTASELWFCFQASKVFTTYKHSSFHVLLLLLSAFMVFTRFVSRQFYCCFPVQQNGRNGKLNKARFWHKWNEGLPDRVNRDWLAVWQCSDGAINESESSLHVGVGVGIMLILRIQAH